MIKIICEVCGKELEAYNQNHAEHILLLHMTSHRKKKEETKEVKE